MKMKYNTIAEFDRDFKKLEKRFRTLAEDLERVKKNAIELCHVKGMCHNVEEIKGAGNTEDLQFYKVKKIACRSLKGKGVNSGLRLIYAFLPETSEVVFLEIYFKGDKENEDRGKIRDFSRQRAKVRR
jgi:mRNA-degrading endonuclease RelE of RelBE toxin-antitoxin system